MISPMIALYALPLAIAWGAYSIINKRKEAKSLAMLVAAQEAGMTEPPSLHPIIDETLCLGCGTCTKVCPEGDILGLINAKAKLLEPTSCIGHGACKTACPYDAIELVFGTATRGVDIPNVSPSFETNVPGIFIAGELGGMGLIANAIEQGRQALDAIAKLDGLGQREQYDVVIVGGGPAGLAASLAAKEKQLNYLTIEQDTLGGAVAHYPRGKLVMTRPAMLPMVGKMKFKEVRKEKLLDYWHSIKAKHQLKIYGDTAVTQIKRAGNGFKITTSRGDITTRAVLLAIGRRGTPRKLEVPGEELSKVVYKMVDPYQYRGQHVLVVGGGDSALEAAAALAEQPGTRVTLSYRGAAFQRAKPANRARIEHGVRTGYIKQIMSSKVHSIGPRDVRISVDGKDYMLPNDAIIVCAGGVLPTRFLKSLGIEVETKYGTA